MRYRLRVEVEYLIMLTKARSIPTIAPLDAAQISQLRELYRDSGPTQAEQIAAIDARVNRDVRRRRILDARPARPHRHRPPQRNGALWANQRRRQQPRPYSLMMREARYLVISPWLSVM
jgi:adenylosuccinate lyase